MLWLSSSTDLCALCVFTGSYGREVWGWCGYDEGPGVFTVLWWPGPARACGGYIVTPGRPSISRGGDIGVYAVVVFAPYHVGGGSWVHAG